MSITVTKGNPSDEELAAVTVVLAAVTAEPPTTRPNTDRSDTGGWNSYWRRVRRPFVYGPLGWNESLR